MGSAPAKGQALHMIRGSMQRGLWPVGSRGLGLGLVPYGCPSVLGSRLWGMGVGSLTLGALIHPP